MKALNFSKLAFVCALVLGVMAFWAAAAPGAISADSLTGGWVPYTGCRLCYNTQLNNCANSQSAGVSGCFSDPLIILLGPGELLGTWYPPPVCNGPYNCGNICDSVCGI